MEDQKLLEKMTEGFTQMNQRFDFIEKRMDQTEKRLDERIDEVLEAMGVFSNEVDRRFEKVDKRFDQLEKRTETIEKKIEEVEKKVVTKDDLHDQLLDLGSDLTMLARRQNKKLSSVVETLVEEGSLSRKAAKRLLALEPFAM